MEKLSISKLIANDIVNYGMDKTMSFNYIVSLNDFMDDYDEESRQFIKSHIQEIKEDVEQNGNVADLHYDEERDEFNMVFYYDNLITSLEKKILDKTKDNYNELELDDLRSISYKIENSQEYDELIDTYINKDLGCEM